MEAYSAPTLQGNKQNFENNGLKAIGALGDVASIINAGRWIIGLGVAGATFLEAEKKIDVLPSNEEIGDFLNSIDMDPALVGFLGMGAILSAYLICKGLSPSQPSNAQRWTPSTPTRNPA